MAKDDSSLEPPKESNRLTAWENVLMNVGEMQRLLSVKAEQSPGHRFDDLFGLVCHIDWLRLAADHVARNTGSVTAGCDGVDMKQFDEDREGNLAELRRTLRSGEFVAHPVRRVYIPKANGKLRPLGIPSVRDRIVQESLRMVLEPIFEADFRRSSFGFRPNRCTMDAIMAVHWVTNEQKKYFWVVEGDIAAYFDTIKHRRLVKLLRRRVRDRKVLSLIWQFLRAGVMERKLFKDTTQGAPQGGILSPLLANVYLHELDKFMERHTGLSENMKATRRDKGLGNYHYVRYADDFVILTNGDKAHALSIRDEVQMFLTSELRIELSMEKTKITHVNDGFDFLGFHLHRTIAGNGKKRLKILVPPQKAKAHLDKLKAVFALSSTSDSVTAKIKAANRIISGWCRYYQFTGQPGKCFGNLEHRTYWLAIQWLATKYKIPYTEAVPRFQRVDGLGTPDIRLTRHLDFKARHYSERIFKPNPYTTQTITITRESLDDGSYWMGNERRPGMSDLRLAVLKRDGYTCQAPGCGKPLTATDSEVHHKLPVRSFRRPVDANTMENLMAVCIPCHRKLTEFDQRMESPVR